MVSRITSPPYDHEEWRLERELADGDRGVIDDRHSVIYEYCMGRIIKYQYIKEDGNYAIPETCV